MHTRTAILLTAALSAALSACATGGPSSRDARAPTPSTARAPAPAATLSPAATSDDDARVDANLLAVLGQGTALPDHVGPDAARAVYDDFDRRPARYLSRLDAMLRSQAPSTADASRFYEVALWRLRARDPEGAARVAFAVTQRLGALSQRPPPDDDAGFRARLLLRLRGVGMVRHGVDVAFGADWRREEAEDVCTTASPDHAAVLFVTRGCTCGEPLACRATVRGGRLEVELRMNQNAPGVCTDCYPGHAACSVPPLPAGVTNPFALCPDEPRS